jgi:dGTPase
VNHDIDDALRAGLFAPEDLMEAPLVGPMAERVTADYGALALGRFIGEVVRRLIGALVADLVATTRTRLAEAAPGSAADIRALGRAAAAFSPEMAAGLAELKAFLLARMYRHPRVVGSMAAAKQVVADLFGGFLADPALLPQDWQGLCDRPGGAKTAGVVRDYIAGMTDRFALLEHRRVFHTEIAL